MSLWGIGVWLWAAAASWTTSTPTPGFAPTQRVRVQGRWFVGVAAPAAEASPGALRVRVLVEAGLEDEAPSFAALVEQVLGAADGWAAAGREFVVVDSDGDIDVLLARPKTVDLLCAPLRTGGSFSCGRKGRAVINIRRWRHGATTFGKDLASYRAYVVNHEVGHLLGFDHDGCPGRGRRAPIMLQQTKSLAGCRRSSRPAVVEIERLGARLSSR